MYICIYIYMYIYIIYIYIYRLYVIYIEIDIELSYAVENVYFAVTKKLWKINLRIVKST